MAHEVPAASAEDSAAAAKTLDLGLQVRSVDVSVIKVAEPPV